jgi:aquaporin Z
VINHCVGNSPISRTAAVIAPGAVVMAMIYALGRCPACTSTRP